MNVFLRFTTRAIVVLGLVALACVSPAVGITIAPTIIGGAFDLAPFDGVADGIDSSDTGRFLANISGTQQRVILEFNLSSLPQGGTITGAEFVGMIRPNNSFDSGTRTDNYFVYGANGQLDLADYNAPGTLIGTTSHPSGGTSAIDLSFAAAMDNVFKSGAPYLGIRIEPVGTHGYDVLATPPLRPAAAQRLLHASPAAHVYGNAHARRARTA